MATPLDIAAVALFDNGWTPAPNDKDALAIVGTVLESLTNEQVVAHAVQALKAAGWERIRPISEGGFDASLFEADLASIARTVLRSVGEAS